VSGMSVDGLRWEVRRRGAGRPLLLVHGFTGRGTAWGSHATAFSRAFRVVTVDLPGHGRSGTAAPDRMTVERTADDLATILDRLGASPAHVLGYSLGARVALWLAVAHPEAVTRLVLESPSAGIADAAEREARRVADDDLAARIERDGVPAFVDEWERQPMFAGRAALPPRRAARIHAMRLANRTGGLAASLRGAGQGAMEPLHDRLVGITAPTLVIAGALDDRGRPRAEQVAHGIPGARLAIVDRAGHVPHDEQPAAFRRLALDFLQEVPAA
jgi:2-succinyl-6-hydroxy-2,4-cyclohexadiene-1-carboxylate synthase